MKKYNIAVGIFSVITIIYLFFLKKFSGFLLEQRRSGVSDLKIFLNHSGDIIAYFIGALFLIILSGFILWRVIKEARCSDGLNDFINVGILILILVILAALIIKMITIPILQILLTVVALVLAALATAGAE